jgi:hypothetical protein
VDDTERSAESAPPASVRDLETVIERWWGDHFPGSPVAQVTHAWNHAFAAKEELKRRLSSFIGDSAQQ